MNEEQVLQKATFDPLTWTYSLHVIRYGGPVSNEWLEHCRHKGAEKEKRWQDPDVSSLHHLELRWPAREPRQLQYGSLDRPCVVWGVVSGQRLSEAVQDAAQEYLEALGQFPVYGFVKRLPAGIEEPADVEIGDGIEPVTLLLASWMPEKFVLVFR